MLSGRIQDLDTTGRKELQQLADVDTEGYTQKSDDFFRYTRPDDKAAQAQPGAAGSPPGTQGTPGAPAQRQQQQPAAGGQTPVQVAFEDKDNGEEKINTGRPISALKEKAAAPLCPKRDGHIELSVPIFVYPFTTLSPYFPALRTSSAMGEEQLARWVVDFRTASAS